MLFLPITLVCLSDSVLAFHDHGLQGRSLKTDEITQEINDSSRHYRVLGSDETIVLESRLVSSNLTSESDIYILTGHENTM
jgi:hypothetical protein